MKLAGKIALVTGGSRGIGRATALAFAAEGADIAFCHLDDDAKARETVRPSLDPVQVESLRAFSAAR